jgi:quercetin dioxygenase-like cupin family protein
MPVLSCLILFCTSHHYPAAFAGTADQQANAAKPTPLILEKNEGERRVWRPIEGLEGQPSPFTLKVDPHNGGSSHLVFGTEDLPPGEKIETHRHPGSDEILFLQNGVAKVRLNESVREVHGGATVFIPANTWVSVNNIGSDPISLVFVFSAPGFEEFMRAESVREGEKALPLSRKEDAQIIKKHAHAVIYNYEALP